MCFFFHSFSRWSFYTDWQEINILEAFSSYGWLGVQLFFIISGFVIFLTLENNNSIFTFLKKRWLRLFPAMLLATAFILISAYFLPQRPLGLPNIYDVIPGLTFIHPAFLNEVFGTSMKSIDGAFWSIYVEIQFYILISIFYYVFRDRSGTMIFLIFVVFLLFESFHNLFFLGNDTSVFIYKLSKIWGLNHYGWFCFGIFFYKYWSTEEHKYYHLSIASGAISLIYLSYEEQSLFILLPASLLILLFVFSFNNIFIINMLKNKVFLFFGAISYPLYLIHQNFIIGFGKYIYQLSTELNSVLYIVFGVLLSILVGYIILKLEPSIKKYLSEYIINKV